MPVENKSPKLELDASFMGKIGKTIIALMKADFKLGIMQDKAGSRSSAYKSESYKGYKSTWGRRKTTRTYKKGTKNIPAGTTTNAGTLLYGWTSVINNKTDVKNYELTGKLQSGLHTENPKTNEITISYNQGDTGKILGANDNGDQLVGLNDNNIETIGDAIFQELSKQVDTWAREDIVITINI